MNIAKKKRYGYLRADNGTKVENGDSEDKMRTKKFSEMQDVTKFMNYVYELPNVRRAIEDYALGGGEFEYLAPYGSPAYEENQRRYEEAQARVAASTDYDTRDGDWPGDVPTRAMLRAPRPTPSDFEFAFDSESIGPPTEGIQVLEDEFTGDSYLSTPISLAEAKAAYEWEEGPPETENDYLSRARWKAAREQHMDMFGIPYEGKSLWKEYTDRNWMQPTEEKEIVKELRRQFPNEPEETFQSVEGLASLMARRSADEFSMMHNFDLMPEDLRRTTLGAVAGKRSPGTELIPLTMGMGQYQRRGAGAILMSPRAGQQTAAHELAHVSDYDSETQEKYLMSEQDARTEARSRAAGYDSEMMQNHAMNAYIYSPTEIRSRLMGLRWNMYQNKIKDPSEGYTVEDVEKLGKDAGSDLSRLREIYDDEAIARMLNNVY
tara:strand:+ start:2032 stop:3333 length:1302 start_codon:yes stop_codon:yes gene_type:complete